MKKNQTKIAVIFLTTYKTKPKKTPLFFNVKPHRPLYVFVFQHVSFLPLCNLIGWYIFFPDTKKKFLKTFFILEKKPKPPNSITNSLVLRILFSSVTTAHYLFFLSKLYSYLLTKKVYVRLTVYLSLVSCACGTLCSGRRRRHLAVVRRTTGLLLLHPKIGVLLLETSSTLSTFTFSKSRQTADSLSNKV